MGFFEEENLVYIMLVLHIMFAMLVLEQAVRLVGETMCNSTVFISTGGVHV